VTLKEKGWNLQAKPNEKQELDLFLKIARVILTICFVVTFFHKMLGRKISLMMMPCHFVTECYLFLLYTPWKANAEIMFNISIHYQFFTYNPFLSSFFLFFYLFSFSLPNNRWLAIAL
jgi:hypothetical protein